MLKKTSIISLIIVLFVIGGVASFVFFNDSNSPYELFAHHDTIEDESKREYILKLLDDNGIQFKVDKKGSIYIREKDSKRAMICCT